MAGPFFGDDLPALSPTARVYLVNVGANAAHPYVSPCFADGRFELLPIPEDPALQGPTLLRFRDLVAWNTAGGLAAWVPPRYWDRPAHADPDFRAMTYGDNCWRAARAAALRRACSGDWLVFLARLCPVRGTRVVGPPGFYLVGALEIETTLGPVRAPLTGWAAARFGENAHVRRALADARYWDGFCLFQGSARSRRFVHARPFDQALAAACLRTAQGAPLVWPAHRSPLQVIGSVTRTIRSVAAPAVLWAALRQPPHPPAGQGSVFGGASASPSDDGRAAANAD